MEVPRFWRNHNYMLNPNIHGYRPEPPSINEPDPSAKITCPIYNGEAASYALREVRSYSELLKDEIPINESSHSVLTSTEIKIPSGIIYQDSSVGTAI